MSTKEREKAEAEGRETYRWVGRVECGICGKTQKSAIEIPVIWEEPIIPLECSKCGSLACTPE